MKQEHRRYQKFVWFMSVIFLAVPFLIMLFNFQVDPNRRYQFRVADEDLKTLARSKDMVLVLPPNFDDRALLKKFVPISTPPDIVVIGGSRIANVHPDFFKSPWNSKLLNLTVTEGTVRDYVALWELVESSGHKPKIVFICVEEQSINSYSQNSKYLSLYEYYTSFFHEGTSLRQQFLGLTTNLKDLLSMETMIASIKTLLHPERNIGGGKLALNNSYDRSFIAKTHAFSTVQRGNAENQDSQLIFSQAQANGLGEMKVFEKWNPKDRMGYLHLEALIQRIKRMGGTPILVGTPYHPAAYEVIRQNLKAHENMMIFVDALNHIAVREGIFFYDAIETHRSEFKHEDFYDGVHLRMKESHRLFRLIDKGTRLGIVADSVSS